MTNEIKIDYIFIGIRDEALINLAVLHRNIIQQVQYLLGIEGQV